MVAFVPLDRIRVGMTSGSDTTGGFLRFFEITRADAYLDTRFGKASRESAAFASSAADDPRAVVVMKEFDGLRYEEIAAILGVPVGTVRSRLHRARLDLRERLKGVVEEDASSRHAARNVH